MKFQFIVMAVYNFLSAAKYGLNLGYVNVQTKGGTSPKWKEMMSVGYTLSNCPVLYGIVEPYRTVQNIAWLVCIQKYCVVSHSIAYVLHG